MRAAALLYTTAATLIAIALPTIAIAHTAGATPAGADTTAANGGLSEIIVTAQHKSESSQKAAIPLSVIDGKALVSAGVSQADQLNALAPALSIEPSSTGNLIFLRGVGNFTVTPTSDPAVAFNYDGVYVGRPTSTNGVFYDLDRVEVLKGPQGTLYGRNATGGAINVLPTQPKFGVLSAEGTFAYGNYNTVNAEAAVNAPLGEHGAVRIAATLTDHDGYLSDGTYDEKTRAVRIQIKEELTPDLTVRLSGDYAYTGGAGDSVNYYGAYVRNQAVPVSAGPVAGSSYYTFVPSGLSDSQGVYSPASQAYRESTTFGPTGAKLQALSPYPFQSDNYYGLNAEINLKTGAGDLTVIPAWRQSMLNYDSSAGAFTYADKEKDVQYSVEARFAGKRISIFDTMLGGYYYNENVRPLTALSLSNTANFLDEKLTTESYAFFGKLVAHLSDRLRLVGGLRYTRDSKGFDYHATGAIIDCLATTAHGAPNCPTAVQPPAFTSTAQFNFPFPAMGGAPIPVFTTPGPPNYLIIRTDTTDLANLKSSKLTYRGAAEFDVLRQSMLYASVESGYRSGGFSAAAGYQTYQPEFITAFTIGMKNRFWNNRAQLNIEGFLWNYTNQQVNHVGLDINGTPANYTQNVGKSRIKGIEADGRLALTHTTLVSADIQYLDTRQLAYSYTAGPGQPPLTGCAVTYTAANKSPYVINCAGMPAYNSPKWTINLAGQQTVPLDRFNLILGVDTQYKSSRYIGFSYLPQQDLSGTWTTNAQVRIEPVDQHWSLAAYISNIENDRIPIYSSTHPTANFLIAGTTAPRTYGVRAGFKF